jgi:hypothetical protein
MIELVCGNCKKVFFTSKRGITLDELFPGEGQICCTECNHLKEEKWIDGWKEKDFN